MAQLVTIYGGSGFVGRYIARRLARQGWRIRVAVRRPNEALFVKSYGAVGQVEPVLCNIRDDLSVRAAMQGADAVINCVGTFDKGGRNNFNSVQVEGAARIARIAAEERIDRLVHISAIGADPQAGSGYGLSKGEGEAAVRSRFPTAVILRPSVIFGPEDQFLNRFAGMSRMGPILPLIGGKTRFQPVYVEDVAKVASMAANGDVQAGIYELGGPDVLTLRQIVREILAAIHRRRAVINLPFWVGSIIGTALDLGSLLTGRLVRNTILTADQVRSLRHDNVVGANARGLAGLGITPTPMSAVMNDYLWRFRPSGQYDEIKASAKNLQPLPERTVAGQ
jgi:NADH dehydrogenase